MAQTQQSYYMDADIPLFYYDDRAMRRIRDQRTVARDLVARVISTCLRNPHITVKIPQIALGEIMLAFCSGKCQLDQMHKLLVEDLHADFPNARFDAFKVAKELSERDGLIKPNDALIISQALVDQSATWLFSTDKHLVGNLAISEKMEELNHYFNIGDRL